MTSQAEKERRIARDEKMAKLPNWDQLKNLQKMARSEQVKIRIWWDDYQMKKNKALHFRSLYERLSGRELFRAGATLLKKAEKWQQKAEQALASQPKTEKKSEPAGTLETIEDKLTK